MEPDSTEEENKEVAKEGSPVGDGTSTTDAGPLDPNSPTEEKKDEPKAPLTEEEKKFAEADAADKAELAEANKIEISPIDTAFLSGGADMKLENLFASLPLPEKAKPAKEAAPAATETAATAG